MPQQKKSDIRSIVTNHQKQALRRVKTLTDRVKVAIYQGCLSLIAANQFQYDLRVYGLWEALLYVENGEPTYYSLGTAEKALNAALLDIPTESHTELKPVTRFKW
jgi:hypothetical protein